MSGCANVVAGELLVQIDGFDHRHGSGGVAAAPPRRSPRFRRPRRQRRESSVADARQRGGVLRGASEPAGDDDTGAEGPVDFDRVRASAERSGGMQMLGPPPFAVPTAVPSS